MGSEPSFDKYANRGAYHWAELRPWPLHNHNPVLAARYVFVLREIGECRGKTVLDLGCGDGALTGLIAKLGAYVIGLD